MHSPIMMALFGWISGVIVINEAIRFDIIVLFYAVLLLLLNIFTFSICNTYKLRNITNKHNLHSYKHLFRQGTSFSKLHLSAKLQTLYPHNNDAHML